MKDHAILELADALSHAGVLPSRLTDDREDTMIEKSRSRSRSGIRDPEASSSKKKWVAEKQANS
jgi:hypothetical protein